jgi:hypothetical protein
MTLPHDFVGPFRGADEQIAINLCLVESVSLFPEDPAIGFCVLGGEPGFAFSFDDVEDYNLAVSILRAKGVLPRKP